MIYTIPIVLILSFILKCQARDARDFHAHHLQSRSYARLVPERGIARPRSERFQGKNALVHPAHSHFLASLPSICRVSRRWDQSRQDKGSRATATNHARCIARHHHVLPVPGERHVARRSRREKWRGSFNWFARPWCSVLPATNSRRIDRRGVFHRTRDELLATARISSS